MSTSHSSYRFAPSGSFAETLREGVFGPDPTYTVNVPSLAEAHLPEVAGTGPTAADDSFALAYMLGRDMVPAEPDHRITDPIVLLYWFKGIQEGRAAAYRERDEILDRAAAWDLLNISCDESSLDLLA